MNKLNPKQLADALRVIVLTPAIRAYLLENDPKALEQALAALGGDKPGQGQFIELEHS